MSAEIYAIETRGYALSPAQIAAELRDFADQVEREELNPMRVLIVTEDRITGEVQPSVIGDRTDHAVALWLLELARLALLKEQAGL